MLHALLTAAVASNGLIKYVLLKLSIPGKSLGVASFFVTSRLRAKAGQHLVACAQRPVVLPRFAVQRHVRQRSIGGDLIFCYFFIKKKVMGLCGQEQTK